MLHLCVPIKPFATPIKEVSHIIIITYARERGGFTLLIISAAPRFVADIFNIHKMSFQIYSYYFLVNENMLTSLFSMTSLISLKCLNSTGYQENLSLQ